MNNILGVNDPYTYIWILPLLSSIHELEEWNILTWYQKYYKNMPESTNTSIRIHIFAFCAVSFALTAIAYVTRGTFLFSLIIAFLSSFLLFNFIQHIIWTAQFKAYSPGLATGLLNVAGIMYVNMVLIENGMVMVPLYAIVLLFISPIVRTVQAKGEMTTEVRNVHRFFIQVEKSLKRFFSK